MLKQKFLLLAAMICGAGALCGADLTTENGKLFKGVEMRKISAGKVHIRHDQGTAVLVLEELPDNFLAALSVRQRFALQSRVDIKLKDGTTYLATSIITLENKKVTIAHRQGTATIPMDQLPAKYLATFTSKQMQALTGIIPAWAQNNKKSAYPAVKTYTDSQGRTIYEGPRGGKYYINDTGKRVYIR